ncbi:MFS transporter [Arthrobacter sp. CAN_A212]|uniref:MFS transporter n=1 Tax=Arthrobacter sp. CAN_A212 TaxID=2787719 RepID=UPI002FF2C67A
MCPSHGGRSFTGGAQPHQQWCSTTPVALPGDGAHPHHRWSSRRPIFRIVLGARTFSQQGMFLLGGIIADYWGPRRSILTGCLIRALGYFGLALSEEFWPFLLSAVLTGIGGAFFSPAVEGLLGALDRTQKSEGPQRRSLFAWLVLFGEIGAVTGPLVGIALLPFGFPVVAVSAACLFVAVGVVLWLLLPAGLPVSADQDDTPAAKAEPRETWACLRDRRFLFFCLFFSVNLLAYNQLYFALPLELNENGTGTGTLALLFVLASVLTIVFQLPASALAVRVGPGVALRTGFICLGLGFITVAVFGVTGIYAVPGIPVLTGPVAMVVLLSFGHMLIVPAGMQQVHGFAGPRPLSAFYGLLASFGGLAVLIGNTFVGTFRDTLGSSAGWMFLILLTIAAAIFLPRFLPIHYQKARP